MLKKISRSLLTVLLACMFSVALTMTAVAAEPRETVSDTNEDQPPVEIPASELSVASTGVNQITLTWTPVADTADYTVAGYEVYRSTDGKSTSWSLLTTVASVAETTNYNYTDTKATAGKYYYKVVAYDTQSEAEGIDSNTVSARSKIAAPVLKSAAAKTYNTVTLSWDKAAGADGYYVYCGSTKIDIESGSTVSYTYKSAIPSKATAYKVQAYYKDGTTIVVSASSNSRSVTTKLNAPVMKTASLVNEKKVKFSWNKVDGASGYEMFINGKSIGITSKHTSCTYESSSKKVALKWGKTYKFTVRAYRVVSGKKYYSSKSAKAASLVMRPKATTSVSTKATAYNTVKVSWKKVSSADGYYIYRKSDSGKFKKVGTVSGVKTLSYSDTKASLGHKYTYRVYAYWKSGSSVQKSTATTAKKTVKTKLNTPKLSDIKYGKNSVIVRWKKVAGAQGYQIFRKTAKGSFKKIAVVKGGSKTSYADSSIEMNKKYIYTVKAYRKSASKTYVSAYNETGKSAKLKITSKVEKITDKNSIMYGKKVRLYYYPDGTQIQDTSDILGKVSSYELYVNKTKNQVMVYTKDGSVYVPVKSFICSVGLNSTPTPEGTYTTKYQYRWQEMMGPSWGQWVTRITWDGILFHSVFYNSLNDNNSLSVTQYNRLGSAGSHGCIRLTAADAKWIYDNCAVGTKVVIYSKSGYEPLEKPTAYKLPSWHTWDPTDPNMYYKCQERGCH